ncbi:flavin reductase [Nocardioides pantholopis]|nr:flavin reductase [Nocardioides pantholopis]
MAQWPSGVTVVTTLAADGSAHGMTASSFSSVSLEPPLVSICLDRRLYTHQLVSDSLVFGINVLAKDQIEVGRRFAGMVKDCPDRFAGETWSTAETGVKLLDSALGWLDCRVVHAYDGGDHTIFVGEVVAARAARRSAPLLFHSRGWGQFADVLPEVATLADTGLVSVLRDQCGDRSGLAATVGAVGRAGVRARVLDLVAATDVDRELATVPEGVELAATSGLVADRVQAHRVLELGVGVVEIVADPADEHSVNQALATVDGIEDRCAVHLVNPFGPGRTDAVLALVAELRARGVLEICLPDEGGRATPLQVRAVLQETVALARPVALRVRLHDRDRLGLVKALTALKSGVTHFDSTLAGLDQAVATEDLIRLLETLDVTTPADTHALTVLAQQLRGETAPGRVGPASVPDRDGSAPDHTTTEPESGTPENVGAAG